MKHLLLNRKNRMIVLAISSLFVSNSYAGAVKALTDYDINEAKPL